MVMHFVQFTEKCNRNSSVQVNVNHLFRFYLTNSSDDALKKSTFVMNLLVHKNHADYNI